MRIFIIDFIIVFVMVLVESGDVDLVVSIECFVKIGMM